MYEGQITPEMSDDAFADQAALVALDRLMEQRFSTPISIGATPSALENVAQDAWKVGQTIRALRVVEMARRDNRSKGRVDG